MLKITMIIRSLEDVRNYMDDIDDRLSNSNLDPAMSEFLREQIVTTLKQVESHMDEAYTGAFNIDRLFEGDGYKVVIKSTKKKPGFFKKILKKLS